MSDTNNSANNFRPGPGKANKRELIKDLATELEKWKLKAQLMGDEVDGLEEKLERTYVEKDKIEQHYQGTREANERVISALRREIAVANAELEAAAMVDEGEAERYLDLLQESRGGPLTSKTTPSLEDVHRHRTNGLTAATSESLVDPPFATGPTSSPNLAPQSSQRVLRGMSDLPFGALDPVSSGGRPLGVEARVAQRMARVEARLNGTSGASSPAPVVPPRPNPLSDAFEPLPLLDMGNSLGLQESAGGRKRESAEEMALATEKRKLKNADEELNRARGDERPASVSIFQKVFPSLGAGGTHRRKASWAL